MNGSTGPAELTVSDPQLAALRAIPERYATPEVTSKLARYVGGRNVPKNERDRAMCDVCNQFHEFPCIHLDYQGHADLTLDLIAVDPLWNWRPAAIDQDTGGPVISVRGIKADGSGGTMVMWGYMTILGVERLCVATCAADKDDPEKELIGDLMRNGGLRYGFATKLWSKSGGADPSRAADDDEPRGRRRVRAGAPSSGSGDAAPPKPATAPQFKLIEHLYDELHIESTLDRDLIMSNITGMSRPDLTSGAATTLINRLREHVQNGTAPTIERGPTRGPLADAIGGQS